MRAAILTISTSVANGTSDDESGPELAELAQNAGAQIVARQTLPDDQQVIEQALRDHAPQADLIFTTGGTGLTPDDVTPEATKAVIERDAPGFASNPGRTYPRASGAVTAARRLSGQAQ